ncbi:MAG: hypothetical protein ABI852_01915 [Gemmatimonadaceae bacterium]
MVTFAEVAMTNARSRTPVRKRKNILIDQRKLDAAKSLLGLARARSTTPLARIHRS